MKNEHLISIIAGLVMLVLSYTLIPQATPHMMMYSPYYSTLPSILAVAGILLVVIPIIFAVQSERCENTEDKENLKRQEITPEEPHEAKNCVETLAVAEKLLEEDEKKVLKIIAENEGVTQDSLHFRTGFSTSKVSMIVKKLEEKDLIYRERFGKTYRLYLSDWVKS
ncbi:DUF7343 domain-containing protein [Geoglobus acetivorans]|uniref:MarR family transcriptional regulator n=1 Tax=Geoglobus acetivorans TaxID=565033 RepID=A0ABZ3H6N8_GEOAI|nr:MarR family transcriptional regulator [Geoglobus acetivorans]